mgnify:CR=1 FL=1
MECRNVCYTIHTPVKITVAVNLFGDSTYEVSLLEVVQVWQVNSGPDRMPKEYLINPN